MLEKWLKGIAGTFFSLMASLVSLSLQSAVPGQPKCVWIQPGQQHRGPVHRQHRLLWPGHHRESTKHRFQSQLLAHHCRVFVFFFFFPHENDGGGLSLFRSVIWRRKLPSWKVTVWPTVTLNPSSNRRTHTWYTGKRTLYTSNLIIILDDSFMGFTTCMYCYIYIKGKKMFLLPPPGCMNWRSR